MQPFDYKKVTEKLSGSERAVRQIRLLDRMTVIVTSLLYIGDLVTLYWTNEYALLYQSVLVPAVSFVVVSVFRRLCNAPRPFEMYDFTPLIEKRHAGRSFPSRHVFSIFMVGMTVFQTYPSVGVFLFCMGGALAMLRVISGVHFIRDVIAGATLGILCGLIGFYLIF